MSMNVGDKKITFMHSMFGSGDPANKCGTCDHLVSYTANRKWFKCECYGDTASEATDWRKKYPSCGLYNMPYNGTLGIDLKKRMPKLKDVIQCDGQMSLFGEGEES